jgi:hypothetical protein
MAEKRYENESWRPAVMPLGSGCMACETTLLDFGSQEIFIGS